MYIPQNIESQFSQFSLFELCRFCNLESGLALCWKLYTWRKTVRRTRSTVDGYLWKRPHNMPLFLLLLFE